ncbi:beta-galactosidase trimerization domain-containing protein, partial [Paenibacillus peoriae]
NDLVTTGGYPGKLRKLLGIWVEEIDALLPESNNRIIMKEKVGALQGEYQCGMLCDLLHSEGAEVLAEYGDDFYQGMPVLTRNRLGQGEAWYVASDPEESFLDGLLDYICEEKGIASLLRAPAGVEATVRSKDGKSYLFILNHNAQVQHVHLGDQKGNELISGEFLEGNISIEGYGFQVLELSF